jgi:hypothetical protein
MINAEDEVIVDLSRSCTREEAAIKLFGRRQGQLQKVSSDIADPLEQLICRREFKGSLSDGLQSMREEARQAFLDAVDAGVDMYEFIDKECAVLGIDALIGDLADRLAEIDHELAKGRSSILRIDHMESDRTKIPHIYIDSLDAWARVKYGISIIESGRLIETPSEPQEVSSAGIETDPGNSQDKKARNRLRDQEAAILGKIEGLGHEPAKLPKNLPGKRGVKADVREALKDDDLFSGETVFDKAWERLLKGDIAYVEKVPSP